MRLMPQSMVIQAQVRQHRRLPASLAGIALSAACTFAPAFADDTEVFFGQVDPGLDIFPNVLFVLDTSGSMNWHDNGYTGSRLERMKVALDSILDNASNVNVGIMRFNGSSGGGAVLFPITPIDEQVCEDSNCGDQNLILRVNADEHDSEERLDNNNISVYGNVLSLGYSGSADQSVGLRFTDLDIPQGAQIVSAKLEFTANSSDSDPSDLQIRAEASDNALAFSSPVGDITGRALGSETASWQPNAWISNNVYQSTDVSNVVQEVIDRSGFCGGNAISFVIDGSGRRDAKSYDSSANQAPVLKVSFEASNIAPGEGCIRKSVVAAIAVGADDGEQRLSNNRVNVRSSDIEIPKDGNRDQLVGLRFIDLAIPQGSVIEEAEIEFEVDQYRSGNVTVRIEGENVDNSVRIRERTRDLSNRARTTAPITWVNPPASGQNAKVKTPDISTLVQQIVDRGGWSSGNAMTFLFSGISGSGKREFESYNGEPAAAPKLRVVYRGIVGSGAEPTFITARDKLKQVVNGLTATGGTPIVDAYYEATKYYLGDEMDYGKKRGYYTNRYHRVSHAGSYTGGTLSRDARCTNDDLDSSYCSSEQINGSPQYISAMESSCQTNHIVFLSDGAATSNSSASKVRSLTGQSTCAINSGNKACGTELAAWLQENDHNGTINGKQNISTYTIGFNFSGDFLPSLATAGGGGYYPASSAAELVTVFQSILGDVLSVDTSFVAPGATVNQFNRLTHRNDIYFALFKPDQRPTWAGNLKRYEVGAGSNGKIVIKDVNGNPAVDPSSGFFSTDAKSWWSDEVDGNTVALGGAAAELSLDDISGSGDRRVFTFTGASVGGAGEDLTATVHRLYEGNSDITDTMLGLQAFSGTAAERADYRENLLKWARGVDVLDEDEDDDATDIRLHMGDPMHSRPVILNYKNGAGADTSVFVATNEGYLHALERDHGKELFAFVPQELLPNLNAYYENQSSTRHPYGLDGAVSVWSNDANENVMVDNGEEAYLYVGMRRGGNNLYALDVSDRMNPRLAWVIKGGDPGFEELGQTWSRAVPTRIRINNQERDVLIFAAGYDTNQDADPLASVNSRTTDSVGRGLFIVDARTGERVWSALGRSGVSSSQYFDEMDYSMPGDVRVIDVDYDGFADQMYVGDTGGQIWRFDFTAYHQSGDLLSGGVMANLSGTALADQRRFFYEPDVALIAKKGQRFLSISIGSGWRAHPLDTVTDDRFFMVRSNDIFAAPAGYGKPRTDGSGTYEPITVADLTDITNDIDPDTSEFGWYLDMSGAGEKILGDSITVNGQIVFSSFRPDASVGACSTAIGSGSVYVVNVLDGSPTVDMDEDGELEVEDREKQLAHGGIPPEPAALITENGPTILVGPEQPVDVDFDNLTQRTYWRDKGIEDAGVEAAENQEE